MTRLVHAITREKAVLIATFAATLTAIENGSFEWEQLGIVAIGLITRFFVTPANEVDERVADGVVEGFKVGAGEYERALIEELEGFSRENIATRLQE